MSDGRVVVITGAARGLGEAIAGRCAGAGMRVLAVDRDEAGVQALAGRLDGAAALGLDLLAEDAGERMVAAAREAFGRIDVLINNAGIAPLIPFLETTPAQLRELLAVNFEMQFLTTQAVVRALIEQGEGGCLIHLGTVHTLVGINHAAAYAGSKAALTAFSRELAVELAEHRIRSNTLVPGPIATERVRRALDEEQIARRVARIPAGRMGHERDIAGAALFLAGDDAAFITGQELVVDGGFTALGTY